MNESMNETQTLVTKNGTSKKRLIPLNFLLTTTIIALSFLWTSCGYLTWLYHLLELTTSNNADFLSEIIGYLFQALGILLIALLSKSICPWIFDKSRGIFFFIAFSVIDFIAIIIASNAGTLACAVVVGYIMNLLHGVIAAYYLHILAESLPQNRRALSFGLGYGLASFASWGISKLGSANLLTTSYAFVIYGVLIVLVIVLFLLRGRYEQTLGTPSVVPAKIPASLIAVAAIAIILLTIARGIGFYFPMADVSGGISLEFSRAFYAIGLISAGILCDRKRSYGAIASIVALSFPFIMLALSADPTPSIVFWILGYIFYGFLNVYRIVLFSDIAAADSHFIYLASFGLLFGRVGDAAGSYLGILLGAKRVALVSTTAAIFAIATVLFFVLYNRLYMNVTVKETNADEYFIRFAQSYGISLREQEVLRLLLAKQSNGEISANLFISENTVKFHMRNMLKKTGCSNRNEIIALYSKQK